MSAAAPRGSSSSVAHLPHLLQAQTRLAPRRIAHGIVPVKLHAAVCLHTGPALKLVYQHLQ